MRAVSAPLEQLSGEEVQSLVLLREVGGCHDVRALERCALRVRELVDERLQTRGSHAHLDLDQAALDHLRLLLATLVRRRSPHTP